MRLARVTFPVVFLLLAEATAAQSAHSRLKDPVLLRRFDNLSRKILCTCGCNMPLRNCNHTGHCNAWPMRDAIDKLLLAGLSDEEILQGFRNGFGKMVETSEAFAMARSAEYRYLLPQLRDGFGSQILTSPETGYLAIFAMLSVVLAAGVAAIFIRSRRAAGGTAPVLDEKRREELLRKIQATD
ncbi:MAG: cytochrome c-type biogenesis protein CcmH [Turneriella sp.]|nr:cytochrome c-type biogenesis protein CcmH [Leptospiraceae bacterium]MCX7633308.1 cytochrome c-type biogenesis protein CcmH [Turneriella sp.]